MSTCPKKKLFWPVDLVTNAWTGEWIHLTKEHRGEVLFTQTRGLLNLPRFKTTAASCVAISMDHFKLPGGNDYPDDHLVLLHGWHAVPPEQTGGIGQLVQADSNLVV